MYETSDFRNGLKIEYDGIPYVIIEFQHVKPGKGNAFTRTRIKSLLDGRVLQPTFKSGEKVGKPDVEDKTMQYLYADGDSCTFMDTQNYEQVNIPRVNIGDSVAFLKENMDVAVVFWNGRAISVELPRSVNLKITECEPGVRGDTATNATKGATLETGAKIQVPLFIKEGETVRIDTESGKYMERVNS
ncbi:MAG: elongation factor P [Deltaproteobacteria bacterium]|nr:elongation factor P [Deltaproteobacteria bacterium]